MYVNQSGIAVCINPGFEDKAVRDGLRPATEDDMQWARGDHSRFALPRIDGYQRGEFGDAAIVVVGAGASMSVPTPGVTRIQCNPRAASLPARFAVALDGVYWRMPDSAAWTHANPQAELYAPEGVHCYEASPKRFAMPIRVIRGQADNYIEIRTRLGIQKANFTGIAAVLFARYLTRGPVVLLGFDMTGTERDANGASYLTRQRDAWAAAVPLWDNVFVHEHTTGFLREQLPVWRA